MSFHHKWQIEELIGCELRLAPRPLLEEVANYLRRGIIILHQHPPMRPPLVMKHHCHPQPQHHLPSRSCSTSTTLATSSPMVWPVNNSVVAELWAKPTHDFRQHPKWDVESASLRNTLISQPHEKHKSPVNLFPQEDLYDSDSVDNQHHVIEITGYQPPVVDHNATTDFLACIRQYMYYPHDSEPAS